MNTPPAAGSADAARVLWLMVLREGIRDALYIGRDDGSRRRQDVVAGQARAWIGTADFDEVVNLAGMDPPGRLRGLLHRAFAGDEAPRPGCWPR
jgi:hypothetical protein